MLPANLRLAWRKILKNRIYSLINMGGLAIGLAVCWLIAVYIINEKSYDQFHVKKDRLLRLTMEFSFDGTVTETATTGTKPGPQFQRSFPELESYCRTFKSTQVVKSGNDMFEEREFFFADSSFFNMFSFPMLRGDGKTALNDLHALAISETAARKYFADANPLGKVLTVANKDYEVKAVFKDVPAASQMKFDFVTRFENLGNMVAGENWWTANWITYLLIKDGSSSDALQRRVDIMMQQEDIRKEARLEGESYLKFKLEPITDVHLHSKLAGFEPNGNIKHVYAFGIVALLVLLVACANYTNLATSQALERVSEIGVRKAMGATRGQLFIQFMVEALAMVLVAGIIAAILAWLALPYLANFTAREYQVSNLFSGTILFAYLALLLIVAFISGLYPAWVIASDHTKLSSGQKFTFFQKGNHVRNALVILQFGISVFLIIYTGVFAQQMNMMKVRDLGYDRSQVLVLPLDARMRKEFNVLKESLTSLPEVESVTAAYETPEFIEWGDGISATDETGTKNISLNALPVDLDLTKTLQMHLIAGRDFIQSDFALMDTAQNMANYRQPYIINETLAGKLGWQPDQAIGKIIERDYPGPVVGVIKDFHFESLHEPVKPLVIFLNRDLARTLMLRINAGESSAAIASVGSWWRQRVPHRPFEYKFLDDNYNSLYETEQRNSDMLQAASIIAIFLGLIGLTGIAAFMVKQRRREIAIRRVLGAEISSIVFITSRKILYLVILGGLLAIPIAWYLSSQWLQGFAFRIEISVGLVFVALAMVVLLAFSIVAIHAFKTARSNPVKSIREA